MALRKICQATGCNRLTEGNNRYCSLHQYLNARDEEKRRQYFGSATSDFQYLYASPKWKVLQQNQLKQNPICQRCGQAQATEVHHIIPHRGDEELFFNPDNLVSLCHDCHSAETRKEVLQRQREKNEQYIKNKRIGKLWY